MSDTHEYRVFVSIHTRFERKYSQIPNIRIFANIRGQKRIQKRIWVCAHTRIYIHYTPWSKQPSLQKGLIQIQINSPNLVKF
jgi:hypothetical protein